jgi:hypothetical protein
MPAKNNGESLALVMGSMGGVAVKTLASQHCGPGSIPGLGVIYDRFFLASRVFLQVLRFFSLPKN